MNAPTPSLSMVPKTSDAIVIGSGPNGLVAANLLANRGWDVVILETQPVIGGAVRSDSSVRPGYVHDTYSSFYPFAAASPAIRALDLEQHGLTWAHAPAVVGTPFRDGPWALVHRDAQATAKCLDEFAAGDGEAYLQLVNAWERIGESVMGAMLTPFPPIRNGVKMLTRLPSVGGMGYLRTLVSPLRALVDGKFRGEGAKLLLGGNAVHADIPMDAPGSGAFGLMMVMLGQQYGFPVPRGGAGKLAQALADRFTSRGGQIVASCRVDNIVVREGRAAGVRTEHGDVVRARKAVLADVSAPVLFGELLEQEVLPPRLIDRMSRFEWDSGTVKVDWALDGPVPWNVPPTAAPGTVHLADSVAELAESQVTLRNGVVPARPFLVVGQMATTDPVRAPHGAESLWAYTHIPQTFRKDGGDGSISSRWDSSDIERMADRMQARLAEHAPSIASRIIARRVMGPHELQAGNENLHMGAINGGTANLHQQAVFRPVAGTGRPSTPIRGLFLASASAHPSGGVHGACGANAAHAAIAHDRAHPWR